MAATLATAPTQVLQGANVSVALSVQNSAPVVTAVGADELDYTGTIGGALTGGASGTAQPLAGGNVHQLQLDTDTAGSQVGSVQVDATSQSAANAHFSQNVNFSVLDHANP